MLWAALTDNILIGVQPYGFVCSSCGGTGCDVCGLTTQDGCAVVIDAHTGLIVPYPATYDMDSAMWLATEQQKAWSPAMVKVWYKAGKIDNRRTMGYSCDPLGNDVAQAIAYIALARLERPFCTCGNVQALQLDLQTDLLVSSKDSSTFVTPEVTGSPFGTRKGEIIAYRRLGKLSRDKVRTAGVIP
jgi:hypothetical protein